MRSDARKRLNPEPLPHWDPAVRALIEQARAEAVAPFAALVEEFDMRARWATTSEGAFAIRVCADAVREALGGAS